jgi:hypothetical protein
MFKRKALAMKKGASLTPRVVNTIITDARINIIENEKLKEAQAKFDGTRRTFDAREILIQQRLMREGKVDEDCDHLSDSYLSNRLNFLA